MKKYYKEMYEAFEGKSFRFCNEYYKFNELAHFSPICGEKYFDSKDKDGKELRFMLVGRATNGWGCIDASSSDEFADKVEIKLNQYGFDWIVLKDGKLCSPSDVESKTDYLISRSSFWRTAKRIWEGLGGVFNSAEPKWMENIIWSNLYKIAPRDVPKGKQGNPTTAMRGAQHKICKGLLQEEIETYKPTHILLETNWNWISWYGQDKFLSIFQDVQPTGNKYAVGTALYKLKNGKEIPVVITRRPEFCKEDNFVDAVIKYFG